MTKKVSCPFCKRRLFDVSNKKEIQINLKDEDMSEDIIIKCQKCGKEISVSILNKT